MQSKVMNKYVKKSPRTPVQEGLGIALLRLSPSTTLVILGALFTSWISWTFVFVYWVTKCIAGQLAVKFSAAKAMEMLSHPKMKEYIENMCHEAYKKAKKTYPTLKEFTSDIKYTYDDQELAAQRAAGGFTTLMNITFLNKELKAVGYKHTVCVFSDTTHIDHIYAVFSHPESKQYIAVPIPAPRKEELKAFFK